MPIRVAINGFGRIGRNTFKAGFGQNKKFEVVAVNDLASPTSLAYLLQHDSVYGKYEKRVTAVDKSSKAGKATSTGKIKVGNKEILVFSEKDPGKLPWKKLKIDVVLESTGIFRTKELAQPHLKAGAKRVIISAPAKGKGVNTYLIGVNNGEYVDEKIIDNASCTTNCSGPVASVMHNTFGIEKALMTTVHGYTANQKLVDSHHSDPRRGRAAAINIVPSTTGAAIATTKAIPDLEGKFDGMAIRVPVPTVSLLDFVFVLKKKTTVEKVNKAFINASKSILYKNVLAVSDEPLVSTDYIKSPYSATIDLAFTKVIDGDLVKVLAWYDNEWGYSLRLAEMAIEVGKKISK